MNFGINKDNVYNYSLKQAWLEVYEENSKADQEFIKANFASVFIKSKTIEERLDKDLSSFTLQNIKTLLKYFGSGSIASIRSRASLFRTYTDFAIESGYSVDGQNHYNELSLDDYKECLDNVRAERGVFDYEEILGMLDVLKTNARDQYLILAPWEGICGTGFKEIINLSLDDLDKENNTVKLCTGRTIKVSSELMDVMEESGTTDYYISSEGNRRPLQKSRLIFKPLDSMSATAVSNIVLTRRMAHLKDTLDTPKLGYNMLRISGFCYHLAKLCAKTNMTPSELRVAKDKNYNELIKKYAFEKKSITEINYMYDVYVETIPSVLKK